MATHWLLPIDPAAHLEHQPDDWRTRPDATAVWAALGRSQPIGRWCLRSGFRTMQGGDVLWAYLSKRQQICARGEVVAVEVETGGGAIEDAAPGNADSTENSDDRWFVRVDWDVTATGILTENPLPRSAFGQVPMSTCRAKPATVAALETHLVALTARRR